MSHPAADSPSPVRPADRVSFWLKSAYGAAGMTNYFGGQLIKVLSASIFVAGMGVSPAHIGWIFLIFSLWDAVIDPFLGWLSDNTRSRWGRRRPFVLAGGLLTGAIFPLFWIAQPEWSETVKFFYLVGIGMVFYTAFSIWAVPFQSMLTEMTPDSTERMPAPVSARIEQRQIDRALRRLVPPARTHECCDERTRAIPQFLRHAENLFTRGRGVVAIALQRPAHRHHRHPARLGNIPHRNSPSKISTHM
jgi:hypothetical protein